MKFTFIFSFLLLVNAYVYGQVNLSQGLVAHFPFDGNANDLIHSSQNASVNGPTLTTDRHGNSNSAYEFDGVNDYMTGSAAYFPVGKQDRTISLWALSKTDDQHKVLFCWGEAVTNEGMGIVIIDERKIRYFGWANDMEAAEYQHPVNSWFHILATFDGDTAKLYLDGKQWAQAYKPWTTGTGPYQIGRNVNLTSPFEGKLDDIRVYDRVVNEDEIKALSQFTPTSSIENLNSARFKLRTYPNPCKSILNIDINVNKFNIQIINNLGQVVYLGENSKTIDISSFSSGLYYINVKTPQGELIGSEKIIR